MCQLISWWRHNNSALLYNNGPTYMLVCSTSHASDKASLIDNSGSSYQDIYHLDYKLKHPLPT